MKILSTNLSKMNSKNRKRVGRGISAGGGKTAGRGTKGQKSRAGHNIPRQFEGGQSNLSLRLPKVRGFKRNNKPAIEISLTLLDATFKAGDTVDVESLIKAGLLRPGQTAKILSNGEITKSLKIDGVNISKTALEKIENVKPAKPAVEAVEKKETATPAAKEAKPAEKKTKATK